VAVNLEDPQIAHLVDLFNAAAESNRPREELIHVVLGAALPLAGGDLAVVCGPDGETVASAPSGPEMAAEAQELAREACRALQNDTAAGEVYIAHLAVDPPYVLAVRWARGRRSRLDVCHAVAKACARLLGRDDANPREIGVDPLTGLPSRSSTLRHLEDAMHVAGRLGTRVGVIFIDLDGFKAVNDTFGHLRGDKALIEAGQQMREAVRRGDLVGRIGGDEFVAVLSVVESEDEMADAAQRFLDRIALRVEGDGLVREVRASIGIAVFPQDGTTADTLLQHADEAMYAAKQAGGKSVCWYRDGVGAELHAKREMRERLLTVDSERDFLVCWQPIVQASTLRVVGAEALIRWRHPSRGWLAPRSFLDAGGPTITPTIDGWVIGAVEQTLRTLHKEWPHLRLHVNIGSTEEAICVELERLLEEFAPAGRCVAVEINEGMAQADPDAVTAFLRRLKAKGAYIGLDGFGALPTSLEMLAMLPLDFLKIGRRITQNAAYDPRYQRIARAAIAVTQALDVQPIADGVESREQARWLTENGAEQLQGYFLAQPMTTPDFAEWLTWSTSAVAAVGWS
jgi:diguanylate cyclase (GGDEF)-like protein